MATDIMGLLTGVSKQGIDPMLSQLTPAQQRMEFGRQSAQGLQRAVGGMFGGGAPIQEQLQAGLIKKELDKREAIKGLNFTDPADVGKYAQTLFESGDFTAGINALKYATELQTAQNDLAEENKAKDSIISRMTDLNMGADIELFKNNALTMEQATNKIKDREKLYEANQLAKDEKLYYLETRNLKDSMLYQNIADGVTYDDNNFAELVKLELYSKNPDFTIKDAEFMNTPYGKQYAGVHTVRNASGTKTDSFGFLTVDDNKKTVFVPLNPNEVTEIADSEAIQDLKTKDITAMMDMMEKAGTNVKGEGGWTKTNWDDAWASLNASMKFTISQRLALEVAEKLAKDPSLDIVEAREESIENYVNTYFEKDSFWWFGLGKDAYISDVTASENLKNKHR